MRIGSRNLITDVPGILVGHADDADLKSGVSVVTVSEPMIASYAVLGGAPGTRETDLLEPDKLNPPVDALFLAGGSAFGLAAGDGIASAMRDQGRGYTVGQVRVPIVPGAICFDLLNGGNKDWDDNPYSQMGRDAYLQAGHDFAIGSAGAGMGALAGDVKGGVGSASLILDTGICVGALVVANPVGTLCDAQGRFWAAAFEMDGEIGGPHPAPSALGCPPLHSAKLTSRQANTTIGVVATDAKLTSAEAKRIAITAHDGITRATLPAHTPYDGDLIFCAATGECGLEIEEVDLLEIGYAAGLCVARAIMRAAYSAHALPGDVLPIWANKF